MISAYSGNSASGFEPKEIWVDGAQRCRDPEQDLAADFAGKRDHYYSALRLPRDAKTFISEVRQELEPEHGVGI